MLSWVLVVLAVTGLLIGLWLRGRARARHRLESDQSFEQLPAVAEQESAVPSATTAWTSGDDNQISRFFLLDKMTEGVLLLDEQRRIQVINNPLKRLLGIQTEVVGRNILEVIRLPAILELVNRVVQDQEVLGCDLDLEFPESRQVEVNGVVIEARPPQPAGILLVFHELTRLRHLENARKEFIANVSHELRTPLSMIKGYLETLLDGAKDNPEVATRFLKTIDKHADRLTFLIEDLLTLSKLESGQVTMNLQPCVLHEIITQVLDDLAEKAAEKSISLVNNLPLDFRVLADANRIGQVLYNLVDNGIKYGEPNSPIIIGANRANGDLVEVSIHNTGSGIPQEAQGRLFERFYRVDGARSREQGGTGLGLAIVKHIVQSHGGSVRVESASGEGATFYFTLPAV